MSDVDDLVLVDETDGVALVTLNRPAKRNALSTPLQRALTDALDRLEASPEVRAVLMTGAGPSFCAGHDLTESALETTAHDPMRYFDLMRTFYGRVWRFPKPIIVAAHGFVGPAGIELLLLSDLVVAGESTVCSYQMYRAGGVTPAFLLPWIVGPRRAKEILLTAPTLDAQTAASMGIVTRVVPDGDVLARATAAAELVAAMPELHTRLSKLLVNQAIEAMGAGPLSALATSVEALARMTLTDTLEHAGAEGVAAVLAAQQERFGPLVRRWEGNEMEEASSDH